jgi:chromosome segregation ATPase
MSPLNKILMSIKGGRAKLAGEHSRLMAALDSRRELTREKASLRAELARLREEVRQVEAQRLDAVNLMKGIPQPSPGQTEQTRQELEQRRAIAQADMEGIGQAKTRIQDTMSRDQEQLGRIEAQLAAPLPVSPEVVSHHRRLMEGTASKMEEIRSAIANAETELAALTQAPDPAAELREELQSVLAGAALGTHGPDDVESAAARLTAAEAKASEQEAGRMARLRATKAGLVTLLNELEREHERLAGAWPVINAAVFQQEVEPAAAAYRARLTELVESWDALRAVRTLAEASGITLTVDAPEVAGAFRDPGQLRLARAVDTARARLAP